ncbi:elongator complex protein 2 isoform X2 [Pectinophora gossypiella]|nr:elongator complex protein 2 isoform X2 [Pectinophora gossypiella]XP_049866730.1 elongator complex protein 2 isoform X2 [Pectinophora gossypiella]XP_049866731.1 elongator complex protein 2 isoform X2 [Pectinophora gossypiella]XP_049866732.1 elongator complex protein 2 isoform X2 [Pectinophora gossypiella]XP_049866734.1 elongator complex protein 2 isoform X2 [Pectinophora gossypiella]XP_049866735.1 elongator complex protein 2 isoform X2 [Pectinophora gossypiella]
MTGHTDGITCVHGIYSSGDNIVVYTGSIDSTVRVWERINGITTFKQTINLNSGLCLTLHSHLLPMVNKPILFCALDDHKIHIFTGDEYHRVHTLTGHEDWVRGLDVLDVDETTILLASASQDTYIRLWRIQVHKDQESGPGIKVEEKVFSAYGKQWAVKLDAVLAGHEGWVYGVQWHPYVYDKDTNKRLPVYRLLSSSLDKTVIIWEPDAPSRGEGEGGDSGGAWVERVRVGEVGGNGLGFYGSRFGPSGKSFLGHGYNGSFHIWRLNQETKQWEPSVVCGGHFSAVEDVRWEPEGRYIMSVSADQTTRVHAPWRRADGLTEWHELARPQVHGYDMASLALVSATMFVSAAEEKVLRVFRAPHNFVHNFKNVTGEVLVEGENGGPEGASVPSLGLSNKAVFSGDESKSDLEDDDGYFVPVHLTKPPTEETLMQNTLWPEVQKLYGHGYEVYTLDASPDGTLVASACKATAQEHAAPLIWETSNWQQIQKLVSHQLTVTQLAFSPDSQKLLSVSRDRKWTLYQRRQGSNSFDIIAHTDKTNGVHSRIIWCCAWAHDGSMFATGSRDGKVCLWSTAESRQPASSLGDYALFGTPLELPNASVTALAFAPLAPNDARILAVGLESGVAKLYKFDVAGWCLLHEMDNSAAHHLAVKRLAFKRQPENDNEVLLASSGADNFVRIHRITVTS